MGWTEVDDDWDNSRGNWEKESREEAKGHEYNRLW